MNDSYWFLEAAECFVSWAPGSPLRGRDRQGQTQNEVRRGNGETWKTNGFFKCIEPVRLWPACLCSRIDSIVCESSVEECETSTETVLAGLSAYQVLHDKVIWNWQQEKREIGKWGKVGPRPQLCPSGLWHWLKLPGSCKCGQCRFRFPLSKAGMR